MIYLASDFHFGHNKEFLYKPRGYNSIFEHDKDVIARYNNIVKDGDIVYILGDVYMMDKEHGVECLRQLKGNKHIIRGNHDTDAKWETYKEFASLDGYAQMLKYNDYNFFLCHYPTLTSNYDDGTHISQRIINISGHTHFKEKFFEGNPFVYNVCLDAHDNKPVSIEDIIKDIENKYTELNNLKDMGL